jgi:hypothetical protein
MATTQTQTTIQTTTQTTTTSSFKVITIPFAPILQQTLQKLDINPAIPVFRIPKDFIQKVANHISSFDIYTQIIANLSALKDARPERVLDINELVRFEIACGLFNLSKLLTQLTQVDNFDIAVFHTATPDFSGIAGLHFDSIKVSFNIRFVIHTSGIAAHFDAIYMNGLSSWCYLQEMTFTQTEA